MQAKGSFALLKTNVMKLEKITTEEFQMFNYLNAVRESGIMNMFGAAPSLSDFFEITIKEARIVLGNWMDNFNEDGYSHLLEKQP